MAHPFDDLLRPTVTVTLLTGFALIVTLGDAQAATAERSIYREDFEDGLVGWSTEAVGLGERVMWHAAPDGECGAGNSRGAVYGLGAGVCLDEVDDVPARVGTLVSPELSFGGPGPYSLELDYLFDPGPLGASRDRLFVTVRNASVRFKLELPPTNGTREHFVFPFGEEWAGQTIELAFTYEHDDVVDPGLGAFLDNVELTNSAD